MAINNMMLAQAIMGGPQALQQLAQQVLTQEVQNGNPVAQNLQQMVQNQDYNGIQNFAQNFCQSNGVNFNQAINAFAKTLRMKQ